MRAFVWTILAMHCLSITINLICLTAGKYGGPRTRGNTTFGVAVSFSFSVWAVYLLASTP